MQTFLPPPAIEFTVFGVPGTAGNKSAFPFKGKDGRLRVSVREGKKDGPPQQWRARVNATVQELASAGTELLDGPLVAWIEFYLPKPASAPKRRRTWPDKKPDLSKLLRAIEDPMNGVLIRDDARIVEFTVLRKCFADDSDVDTRPRAEVRLWTAPAFYGEPLEESRNGASTTQAALDLAP